jgi:transposase
MSGKPTKTPRTGRPKGGSALANPALRAIRAQAIIEARAKNVPVKELAGLYNCSEQTIYRYINWAEKEGILGELQNRVRQQLGKLSLDVYESAMKANPAAISPTEIEARKMQLGAAKDVAFGSGILTKKTEQHVTKETESLAWYYELREKRISGEQTGSQEETPGIESGAPDEESAPWLEADFVESDELLGLPESPDGGDRGGAGDGGVGEAESGDSE